jgi:hypothetical protein
LFQPQYAIDAITNSHITAEAIRAYVDTDCSSSCLVFVDGKYSAQLSNLSGISKDVIVKSLLQLDSTSRENFNLGDMLAYIPDKGEKMRNSYASDSMTALNMVSTAFTTRPHSEFSHHFPVAV